jgi:hypothetical protein
MDRRMEEDAELPPRANGRTKAGGGRCGRAVAGAGRRGGFFLAGGARAFTRRTTASWMLRASGGGGGLKKSGDGGRGRRLVLAFSGRAAGVPAGTARPPADRRLGPRLGAASRKAGRAGGASLRGLGWSALARGGLRPCPNKEEGSGDRIPACRRRVDGWAGQDRRRKVDCVCIAGRPNDDRSGSTAARDQEASFVCVLTLHTRSINVRTWSMLHLQPPEVHLWHAPIWWVTILRMSLE